MPAIAMNSHFAGAALSLESVSTFLAPIWIEVSFLVCFILGFIVLRFDVIARRGPQKPKKVVEDFPFATESSRRLEQAVDQEEKPSVIAELWRAGARRAPTPPHLWRGVVQALVAIDRQAVVAEVLEHLRCHAGVLANARTVVVVLDVLARAGCTSEMAEVFHAAAEELDVQPSLQIFEVLLGGFATAGNEAKVAELMQLMRARGLAVSARGLSLTIKGFLKNGKVDAVVEKFRDMKAAGFQVPLFAVTQLFRIASDASRAAEIFDAVLDLAPLSPEAVGQLLEDALRRGDAALGRRVEAEARRQQLPLTTGAYDALLKLYTMVADVRAIKLFEEAQAAGQVRISEGLCVGLLARCAEVKFLRFAEEIVKFARARGGMTISTYSALMKVYAYCNMYEQACDLYDQICEDGLEPDAMMYGCLMKFAVECGRTDLSRRLSETAPRLDIQNYMSLIRAAGRDKDVGRAFEVLGRLKSSGVRIDIAAYNCALDVCVSAGSMDKAVQLMNEMKAEGAVDVVTYNTLMKGFCQHGDLAQAKDLLKDMEHAGLPPNDVSYNCLINAAVNLGNSGLRDAWDILSMMESKGVQVDHYTLSIMMKALKRTKHPADVQRALALLDRSGVEVLSDEILLNTVLETCTRHQEFRRLEAILRSYRSSNLKCSVHTYGTLIKAASTLKQLPLCWDLWREMEQQRGLVPNEIALGCMLDALVTNRQVNKAVELFEVWKERIPANTVMYSTILKGYANTHQADRAMRLWQEMVALGLRMNVVVYNAVIDAQARVGAMEHVSELLAAMDREGLRPDVISLSTIVKGYCVKGDVDMACNVFRDMQKNNMVKDSVVYNTLLDGCTRNNRFDVADKLLRDMDDQGIKPTNFTMGILMKMWGRRRQLDKAFEALEVLPKRHGFTANSQVKTCLICACINNNAISRAYEVFDGLRLEGQAADGKVYSAMVGCLVRQNHLDKALALVEDAYGLAGGARGLAPGASIEAEVLERLVGGLMQAKGGDKVASPLLDKLHAAKAPVSSRLFASVLGGGHGRGEGRRGARR